MRELTEHIVNPANDKLHIRVLDNPGQGGACHRYEVSGYEPVSNSSMQGDDRSTCTILFQNGPINELGVNGITHEVLLAILAARLRSFQAGQYACRENAVALTHIETAQMWLQKRTRDRMARGVEGTHTA